MSGAVDRDGHADGREQTENGEYDLLHVSWWHVRNAASAIGGAAGRSQRDHQGGGSVGTVSAVGVTHQVAPVASSR